MNAKALLLVTAAAASLALATQASADTCAGAPVPGAVKLTVENTSLRAAQGEVQVTVYPDNPRRFLAPHGKVARTRVSATLPVTSSCFWLPPGVYAVAVYHDQNDNHDFDRSPLGMPVEGFGFSNDAPTRFGLPAFDTVRFTLPPGGRTIRVKIRYQHGPG